MADPTSVGTTSGAQIIDVDRALLEVLRNLNLAVAVVAEARESRYRQEPPEDTKRNVNDALIHLRGVVGKLDRIRQLLGG